MLLPEVIKCLCFTADERFLSLAYNLCKKKKEDWTSAEGGLKFLKNEYF
jgi:hypothetical protein